MGLGRTKFNWFIGGAILFALIAVVVLWFTNPELITAWFSKEKLQGTVQWSTAGDSPQVIVTNTSDLEWKDVKVTLNKNSVTQRYDCSVPSIKKHPRGLGFHIPAKNFTKTGGEAYDTTVGAPHLVTVEATLPEGKAGSLEVKLGDKKL